MVPADTMSVMDSTAFLARPRVASETGALGALVDARSIALLVLSAVIYGLIARVSLLFMLQPQNVAGIWPAAGVGVGLLLVSSPRRWPAVIGGLAAGVAGANLSAGVDAGTTLGFTAAHSIEPLLAAALLRRANFRSLGTLREVGLFLAVAAVAGPAVGGILGGASAAIGTGAPFLPALVTWALGSIGGVLALAPVVLLLGQPHPPWLVERRPVETLALGTGIALVTGIAFLPLPIGIQPSSYTTFFLLVVAALRFGVAGATLSTLAVAAIATVGTLAGYGPIALVNSAHAIQLGQLHIFVAVVFLVAFVTAATIAERRASADDLERQRALEAERAARNERMTAFAREIARSIEPDGLFQRIVQAAGDVVDADVSRLTVAIEEGGPHRIVAAVGAPGAIGRIIQAGDGITGSVIQDGTLRVIEQSEPATGQAATSDRKADLPRAIACAPIVTDGSVVATLALARFDSGSPFNTDEVRALEMMAELAAIALRNAVAFEKAQDLSIRDELTGVPNRRYFETSFAQLTAQRERQAADARDVVSAVLFDLDHFGPINKERGHATGDLVLAEFGRLLAARLRRADVVARYGGEEFVAVLVGTDRDGALRVANEIRSTLERTPMTGADGDPIRCTVSAGVATTSEGEASLASLLPTADVALSMAKRAGRNMVSSA